MIKLITALSLIVTATAVFMADYFVPHQHHVSSICFGWSSGCSGHQHNDAHEPFNHQHENEDDCVNCKLKYVFTWPSSQFNLKIKHIQSFIQLNTSILLLYKNSIDSISSYSREWNDPPGKFLPKLNINRCAQGLRAPPTQLICLLY